MGHTSRAYRHMNHGAACTSVKRAVHRGGCLRYKYWYQAKAVSTHHAPSTGMASSSRDMYAAPANHPQDPRIVAARERWHRKSGAKSGAEVCGACWFKKRSPGVQRHLKRKESRAVMRGTCCQPGSSGRPRSQCWAPQLCKALIVLMKIDTPAKDGTALEAPSSKCSDSHACGRAAAMHHCDAS